MDFNFYKEYQRKVIIFFIIAFVFDFSLICLMIANEGGYFFGTLLIIMCTTPFVYHLIILIKAYTNVYPDREEGIIKNCYIVSSGRGHIKISFDIEYKNNQGKLTTICSVPIHYSTINLVENNYNSIMAECKNRKVLFYISKDYRAYIEEVK